MRRKILLIDSTGSNRKLIQDLLTTTGLELIEAKNEQQILEMAICQHPSLILVDTEIAFMSSKEVITILRQNPATFDIRIIPLACQSAESKPAGFSMKRFTGLSTRPVQLKALVAKLQPYVNIAKLMAHRNSFST